MNKLQINILNKSKFPLPKRETIGSSGFDLRANLRSDASGLHDVLVLNPFETKLIPTGLYLEIPLGYEAQIRSRSGLSLKENLFVANSPGTIDSDYRGEIGVLLYNGSMSVRRVEHGKRIAQMVFVSLPSVDLNSVEELGETVRGSGGFGSTGTT